MRNTNTQECLYFGRKLSGICCDGIETSQGYVCIGSDRDDEIYFNEELGADQDMLKDRVKISAIYEPEIGDEEGYCVDLDLEDVLFFAARYCQGLYRRVLETTMGESDGEQSTED